MFSIRQRLYTHRYETLRANRQSTCRMSSIMHWLENYEVSFMSIRRHYFAQHKAEMFYVRLGVARFQGKGHIKTLSLELLEAPYTAFGFIPVHSHINITYNSAEYSSLH